MSKCFLYVLSHMRGLQSLHAYSPVSALLCPPQEGWCTTPSLRTPVCSQVSRCGGWSSSTWSPSLTTCTEASTPAMPTSSSTPSSSALGPCSMICTSGWVSGSRLGRSQLKLNVCPRKKEIKSLLNIITWIAKASWRRRGMWVMGFRSQLTSCCWVRNMSRAKHLRRNNQCNGCSVAILNRNTATLLHLQTIVLQQTFT